MFPFLPRIIRIQSKRCQKKRRNVFTHGTLGMILLLCLGDINGLIALFPDSVLVVLPPINLETFILDPFKCNKKWVSFQSLFTHKKVSFFCKSYLFVFFFMKNTSLSRIRIYLAIQTVSQSDSGSPKTRF
jgi:hypothetical protein